MKLKSQLFCLSAFFKLIRQSPRGSLQYGTTVILENTYQKFCNNQVLSVLEYYSFCTPLSLFPRKFRISWNFEKAPLVKCLIRTVCGFSLGWYIAHLSDSGEIKPVVKKTWRDPTENEYDIEKLIYFSVYQIIRSNYAIFSLYPQLEDIGFWQNIPWVGTNEIFGLHSRYKKFFYWEDFWVGLSDLSSQALLLKFNYFFIY